MSKSPPWQWRWIVLGALWMLYGAFSIDFGANCCVNIIKPRFSKIALFNQRLPVWVSAVLHAGVEVRERALKGWLPGWGHRAVSWGRLGSWRCRWDRWSCGAGVPRSGREGWEHELLLLLQPWPWEYLPMALLETVVQALCCVSHSGTASTEVPVC